MPSDTPATTVVSAPGKVLAAGGYLVLDRQYRGLVIATSSRFYCAVRSRPEPHFNVAASPSSSVTITVRAGQFPAEQSTWTYIISRLGSSAVQFDCLGPKNKFVGITLRNAINVCLAKLSGDLHRSNETGVHDPIDHLFARVGANGADVVVLAHNDFYSQRSSVRHPQSTSSHGSSLVLICSC